MALTSLGSETTGIDDHTLDLFSFFLFAKNGSLVQRQKTPFKVLLATNPRATLIVWGCTSVKNDIMRALQRYGCTRRRYVLEWPVCSPVPNRESGLFLTKKMPHQRCTPEECDKKTPELIHHFVSNAIMCLNCLQIGKSFTVPILLGCVAVLNYKKKGLQIYRSNGQKKIMLFNSVCSEKKSQS